MKAASAAGGSDGQKNAPNNTIWLIKMNLMAAAGSDDVQSIRAEIIETRSCIAA